MVEIERRGLMLVLSSPSGAGKTTIVKSILDQDTNIDVSISVTTRPIRAGEEDGKDYFFIERDRFREMVRQGELLEHAEVFNNGYGTPKKQVLDTLATGRDIIFDIDWQGTQQLAQLARTDLVSIFILPPSTTELEHRLQKRGQDSQKIIQQRMNEAANEMSHWAEYDYVIINHDLKESVQQVNSILTAERLRRTRQKGLIHFVNTLRGIE